MYFVFSKILVYFLSPTLWIICLFIIGLITKRKRLKKYCLRTSVIMLVLFSNPFLLNQFAKWWDVKPTVLPVNSNYSCAIILGGYGSEAGDGTGYFNITADRFIQAIKLKTAGTVSHLLITGGNPRLMPTDFREGDWVAAQLRDLKIDDSSFFIENQSRNSFENAIFSKRILDSNNLKPPYLLVTSAYHMRRALYTYKKEGLDVVPYPGNYLAGREKISFVNLVPKASVLANWEFYIKEMVGYLIYSISKK